MSEFIGTSMALERYFSNNGVVLVKFYLNMDDDAVDRLAKEFATRISKTESFLTDDHIDPKKWKDKVVMPMIAKTSTVNAPWDIVDVSDIDVTMATVVRTLISRVNHAMDAGIPVQPVPPGALYPNPRLSADLSLEARSYRGELEELSIKVAKAQTRLAESGRSMVIVFEGWDAAGKGGSIKRLVRAMNPRGYYVRPVAAPALEEKLHSYLWRFTVNLPKAGHITIYDRSWYGRVLVERVEGFATDAQWARAYDEINEFEQELVRWGAVLLKFWVDVSQEEQLARFRARQEDPAKQWKITDEDWRNREKWDTYCEYVDRMIASTNTPYAPWVVVESEDKKYGRLKVLRTVVEAIEKELD